MPKDMGALPNRNCSGCGLCCVLLRIEELDKPPMIACVNCEAGGGCRIYPDRPTECRQFYCGYLLDPALDERWKPSRSKLLVSFDEYPYAVAIHVDPAFPDAWRAEPFHSKIRLWAQAAALVQTQVVIWQGDTKIIVPPEPQPDLTVAACD